MPVSMLCCRAFLFTYPHTLPIFVPPYLPTYLPIYLPPYLSPCLSPYLSIFLPIYLPISLPPFRLTFLPCVTQFFSSHCLLYVTAIALSGVSSRPTSWSLKSSGQASIQKRKGSIFIALKNLVNGQSPLSPPAKTRDGTYSTYLFLYCVSHCDNVLMIDAPRDE